MFMAIGMIMMISLPLGIWVVFTLYERKRKEQKKRQQKRQQERTHRPVVSVAVVPGMRVQEAVSRLSTPAKNPVEQKKQIQQQPKVTVSPALPIQEPVARVQERVPPQSTGVISVKQEKEQAQPLKEQWREVLRSPKKSRKKCEREVVFTDLSQGLRRTTKQRPVKKSPLDILLEGEDLERLERALSQLDKRSKIIIRLRYGISKKLHVPPIHSKTLKEIAGRVGLSRERVRQIEMETLQLLREILEGDNEPLSGARGPRGQGD